MNVLCHQARRLLKALEPMVRVSSGLSMVGVFGVLGIAGSFTLSLNGFK
jgi:hypothetical protein